MIELALIPDVQARIPSEATDHRFLWKLIQNNSSRSQQESFKNNTPADGFRDIQRIVYGNKKEIVIRLPGLLSEYPINLLDDVELLFTNNVSGLKTYPRGWREVRRNEISE